MSSTNRGSQRSKFDFYVTPEWLVSEFLDKFARDFPMWPGMNILDPCAGGSQTSVMPYPRVLGYLGYVNVNTIDIRPDSKAEVIADYREYPKMFHYDLIITNPSFELSTEITRKAVEEADTVVMLQRLNWIGSEKRAQFWKDMPLAHVYAHSSRASFTPDGKQDSIEYAHFVFQKGYVGKAGFDIIF